MVTFTDLSNLTAKEWGFPKGPLPSWLQHHRYQPPLVTPWAAAEGWGTNFRAGKQGGSSQLWSLLGSWRRTAGNTPHGSLAAIPVTVPHFHCLHSPATWLSTMSFIHWNQTKTCAWKGECSAWHTHSTPCTDGQAAHRVPVSLRSCLKSLSCTQPEWAKQTPLRGQSPVLWPVDVCRQVVSAVPMLYQLGLKLSNWNRPLQFFNW